MPDRVFDHYVMGNMQRVVLSPKLPATMQQ